MRMLQRMMKDRETGVCEQGLVANPTARIFAENLEEAITIVLSPKSHVSRLFFCRTLYGAHSREEIWARQGLGRPSRGVVIEH